MKRIVLAAAVGAALALITVPKTTLSKPTPSGVLLAHAWQQYLSEQSNREPGLRYPYEHCFRQAAQAFDIPLTLLLAIARGESDFNPKAVSDRSAYGLMQIQWPGTARHLGIRRITELYVPCTNVRAGAKYLRELLDRYEGSVHMALAAYNYGPRRIKVGVGADEIPQGARWYSSYIFRHLQYVLGPSKAPAARKVAYENEGKLEVLVFYRPYRAEAFVTYLQTQEPSLRLDWFRLGLGRFRVVLLYLNEAELTNGKQALHRMGLSVN